MKDWKKKKLQQEIDRKKNNNILFICLRRTLYKMAHIFMKQRILAQTDIINVTHIHLTQQNGFVRHYH